MNKFLRQKKEAFGIIEVLIASAIIIVILAALTMTGRATLNSSSYLQERTQALYLAQEGIESVRQMRDTAWIDTDVNTNWGTIANLSGDYAVIYSQTISGFVATGSANTGKNLTVDGTQFTRLLTFSSVGGLIPNDTSQSGGSVYASTGVAPPNAKKVTATVTWSSVTGGDKSISVSEVLTNWRPNY